MARETTAEAENSDFNLSAVNMGCSSQLQETQTIILTATVPETLMSPIHISATVAKAQLAAQQECQQKQLLGLVNPGAQPWALAHLSPSLARTNHFQKWI